MSNMFSFDPPASSGASGGGLFGTAGKTNATAGSGAGLFGNVGASTTGSSAASPFGSAAAPAKQGSGLFGGGGGSGSGTASPASSFSFGTQNQPGSSTPTSLFGNNASQTPNKPSEAPAAGQASSGLFGNAGKPAGGLFGGNSATPGQSGGSLFGGTSTTPAGPPPSGNTSGAQGPSLFGQNANAQKPGGLFGGLGANTSSSTTPSAPATTSSTTPSLFGGASQPQAASGGLFGAGAQQKPSLGSTPAAPAGGGLFGGANKDKPAESTTPTSSTAPASKPLFGGPGAAPSTQGSSLFPAASSGTDSASKPAFSLNAPASTAQSSTTPAASAATAGKSLFPAMGGSTSSAAPSSTPAAAPAGGLFAGLGGAKSTETSAPSSTTTAAPTTQPAPAAGGLFGKPAASTATSQPSSTAAAGSTAPKPAGTEEKTTPFGGNALGASTAGPVPPTQSRLKNKTMDEIITRWATDLTKYQKDFREQAEKVAEWDRMLVDNGTKVQKLYGSTVDAERATQEVERQLASVEGQQEELSSWLDRYEREVDEMMSKQVGPGESLQGPDQERERTYKLAEKLSERLDDVGKDLTSMIEEVNGASSTLSKTNKADEPISQIVRILNSHLSQLQVIDQGTADLQSKVAAAQKAGQAMSSRFGHGFSSSGMGGSGSGMGNGGGSGAADDFYRSYMGRR
ncbi:Nsp1-like C-terminal region-domain-containing protein [Aspergillus taichungensis]|uniref:Nucleoporin NSP1 n=1 Tax=Aspergillus taichungensis TaxID=482145 RepID=A0A2J5I8B3_9EURO|nr:Nsp1-like C-terminal region-domain-containing protein [Aspergillus taichungensis]